MADFQVTCITPDGNDRDRRIDAIGGRESGGWRLKLDNAINQIDNNINSFYTQVNNQRANVIVAYRNGRAYLKTTADGDEPNNLLSLPTCPQSYSWVS